MDYNEQREFLDKVIIGETLDHQPVTLSLFSNSVIAIYDTDLVENDTAKIITNITDYCSNSSDCEVIMASRPIEQLSEELSNLHSEMMKERFKTLEEAGINHIAKLPDMPFKQKIYIIKNIDISLFQEFRGIYKYIDTIKFSLSSIARLGKAAGIHVIFEISDIHNDIYHRYIYNNILTYIISGKVTNNKVKEDIDTYITKLPKSIITEGNVLVDKWNNTLTVFNV